MKAFAQVHPYMILTVPLVIEKIIKKKVFPVIHKPVMKVLWNTPIIKNVIRKKVHDSLMAAFGNELRYLIIGGAALNKEVEQVLKDVNLCYCVGYGMTECGPLISYSPWQSFVFHSCGRELPQCHIRVDSEDPQHKEGEVQVKGVNVMKGYYKNEEATKAVFTEDGWMRTGDLGVLDAAGNLFLRGRSKHMILSSNGQNIYPEEIEAAVNNQPYVVESVVVDRASKLVALVYLDQKQIETDGLDGEALSEKMHDMQVILNKSLPSYSQISKVEIVDKPFEKTPKMSIKRFLYR